MKRKEEPIQRDIKEEETIVMPVSVATDTTLCKMIIEPDTFSVQSDVIPTVLINYLEEDAFYGDDISRQYYNESTGKWENAHTPSNLISTYMLWRIPAQSKIEAPFVIFDHRPGRYRFKMTILKPRKLIVGDEFVLSETSGNISKSVEE